MGDPGVYASRDGITVYDTPGTARVTLGNIGGYGSNSYGLQVIAADGSTVIIDGTSDVFKIAATGTISTTNVAGTPRVQTANVDVVLGGPSLPSGFFWQQFADGLFGGWTAGEQCPSILINTTTGAIAFIYEGWVEYTATSGTFKVVVQTTATPIGAGGTGCTYRYYLLLEASF